MKIISLKRFSNKKSFLPFIFGLGLFSDIFLNPEIIDLVVLVIICLWLAHFVFLKLSIKYGFSLAGVLFLIAFFSRFFCNEVITEKNISYAAIFLVIALVQRLLK